jgi:hypothetical protein
VSINITSQQLKQNPVLEINANNTGNTSGANAALKGLAFQFPSKHKYCQQNSILFINSGPEIHSTF